MATAAEHYTAVTSRLLRNKHFPPQARYILIYIADLGEYNWTLDSIAELTGCSRPTVIKYTAWLERHKLLSVHRHRGCVNEYTLTALGERLVGSEVVKQWQASSKREALLLGKESNRSTPVVNEKHGGSKLEALVEPPVLELPREQPPPVLQDKKAVVALLESVGVNDLTVADEYSIDQVQGVVNKWERGKHGPGWIVTALRNGWELAGQQRPNPIRDLARWQRANLPKPEDDDGDNGRGEVIS